MKNIILLILSFYTFSLLSFYTGTNPPDPTTSPTITPTSTPSCDNSNNTTPIIEPTYPSFTLVSADASGDPHFITLDGAVHDFQGVGIFSWIEDSYVKVQVQTIPCQIGSTVSCIAKVWAQNMPTGNEDEMKLLVSYGYTSNIIEITEVMASKVIRKLNITFNSLNQPNYNDLYLGDIYTIKSSGNSIVIAPNPLSLSKPNKVPAMAITHTIGYMYYAISLPNAVPHKFYATGVLAGGMFDGSKTTDFCLKYLNTTVICCANPNDKTINFNGRINTPACNEFWLKYYAVDGKALNPLTGLPHVPLMTSYVHSNSKQLTAMKSMFDVPAVIPNNTDIDNMMKLKYPNLNAAQTAINYCKSIFGIDYVNKTGDPTTTDVRMQNCIMDGQYISSDTVNSFVNHDKDLNSVRTFHAKILRAHIESGTAHLLDFGEIMAASNAEAYFAAQASIVQVATGSTIIPALTATSIAAIVTVICIAVASTFTATAVVLKNGKLQAKLSEIKSSRTITSISIENSNEMANMSSKNYDEYSNNNINECRAAGKLKLPNSDFQSKASTNDGKWTTTEGQDFIWARDGGVSRPMHIIHDR